MKSLQHPRSDCFLASLHYGGFCRQIFACAPNATCFEGGRDREPIESDRQRSLESARHKTFERRAFLAQQNIDTNLRCNDLYSPAETPARFRTAQPFTPRADKTTMTHHTTRTIPFWLSAIIAAPLAASCTVPNPDHRGPIGLVVSDAMAKQSYDLVFEMHIDAQKEAVMVSYEAADDTAVKNREYRETKGTFSLEPGATTATIVVPTLLYNYLSEDAKLKVTVTVSRGTVNDSQTGTGTISPVAELARFSSLAAGRGHTCGVTTQGTVKC